MNSEEQQRHEVAQVERQDSLPKGRYKYRPQNDAQQTKGHSTHYLKRPTLGDLLQLRIPERRYLLRPWLREQENCMVYAATGIGKSLFALSAAIAIAGRTKFLDWEPEEKADGSGWRVLYIDGEMHIGDLQERARQLRAGMPKLDTKAADANLSFLSRQQQDGLALFPSITEASGQKFVIEQVKEQKFDLVILDNFTTLGEVEDENAASSFNALQQFLLGLKTQGVATILVHHTGKAGDTYRGSSKLAATFETMIHLEPPRLASNQKSNGGFTRPSTATPGEANFRVVWDKCRAGPKRAPLSLVAQLTSPKERSDAAVWSYEVLAGSRLEAIAELLPEGTFATQAEMATYFEVSPQMINKDIKRGTKLGLWNDRDVDRWTALGKQKRRQGEAAPLAPDTAWRSEVSDGEGEDGDDPIF